MAKATPNSVRQQALARGLNPATVSARIRRGDTIEQALNPELRHVADLSGQRFGMLLVVKEEGRDRQGGKTWLCQCDCGRTSTPSTGRLRMGVSTSCGCRRGPSMAKANEAKRIGEGQSAANVLRHAYLAGARNRGHAWGLSKEDFLRLTAGDCYYCGASPAQRFKPPNCWSAYIYNGIDRVDNALGYVEANCVSCCTSCNKTKGRVSRQIIERAFFKLTQKEPPDGQERT